MSSGDNKPMDNAEIKYQAVCFAKGLGRVVATAAIVGIVFFALNVVGYWLSINDVGFSLNWFGDNVASTKSMRVISLALNGLANLFVFGLALALAMSALVAAYKALLSIGGYKDPRKRK